MEKIKDVIRTGVYKSKEYNKSRFLCNVNSIGFASVFLSAIKFDFIVDAENKDIINQLFFYLNKSDKFNGDFEKGILLIGAIGSGKTVIMDSFCKVVLNYGRKIITKIQALDMVKIAQEIDSGYNKKPMYIDDIGKEPIEILHYGSMMRPFEDLLDTRYRNNAITFGTSNLTLDDMKYNKHTKDRIKEMFNIIILSGKSRRS